MRFCEELSIWLNWKRRNGKTKALLVLDPNELEGQM